MRMHTIKQGNDLYLSRNDLLAALQETPPSEVGDDVLRFVSAFQQMILSVGGGLAAPAQPTDPFAHLRM